MIDDAIASAMQEGIRLMSTAEPTRRDYLEAAGRFRQAVEWCRRRAELLVEQDDELVYDYAQEVQP